MTLRRRGLGRRGLGRRGLGWRGLGLAPRLFAATALVVLAGAGTLLAVALLVAPGLFHQHLRMAVGTIAPDLQHHVDEAFGYAILISLGTALLVAVAAALTVTALVSRRIAGPVTELAAAAHEVADGRYQARVPEPGLGPEFAAVTGAFNRMAGRLADAELLRRRLLVDLAHELRTPIASIEATVEAIADGVLPPDGTSWATLSEQAGRLARLISDLDAVSRAEQRRVRLDPRPVPLADLIDAAAAGARARYAGKGVNLQVSAGLTGVRARVDADRLGEALGNLLDNALRHTPPGGTVWLRGRRVRRLGRESAQVVVADDGEGFPPDQAEHLFERFYRVDTARARSTGGSGIGLSITRSIVHAHHGSVRAHSDGPGRGARFEVTLPIA
jgi:signal transduction histidine kinase